MAAMTVSLPEPLREWVDAQVRQGRHASADAYVRDLILRDRAHAERELSLDNLQEKISASKASGFSSRTVDEIYAQAENVAKARG